MVTPTILLGLLTLPLLMAVLLRRSERSRLIAGVLGLTLVFLFTGVGHFVRTEAMAQMIPPIVPARHLLIYLTGVVEICAGVALLLPTFRRATGWFLMTLLVCLLPFNIYAAWQQVPMGGHEWGPAYLLIRIPLQVLLFAWTYWFAVRRGVNEEPTILIG